jgi:zinc protease
MKRSGRQILAGFPVSITVCLSLAAFCWGGGLDREVPFVDPENLRAVERVFPSTPGDLFVQLRNGLTVLVREAHASKVVSVQVLVKTGSIHEDRYLNAGISHYLEHLVSGGTTTRFSEDEAKRMVQAMGGASNAYTSYDRTVYFINTTSSHYKQALNLLMAYVTECTIDVREFEREREVIQQEMRLADNNPDRQLWKIFTKTAYQVHPIRHPIIGYENVFVRIRRDQLQDYYKSRYVPQNMVIGIVGDIDPQKALGEVIRLAGDLKRGFQKPVYVPREPPQVGPRWVEKRFASARLTSMNVGFPSVTLRHDDLYALDVLAIILGRGRTGRLYRRLKDQDKLVLSVGAFNWTPSFARGTFVVTMTLDGANQEEAMKSLWDEIEDVQKHRIRRKELEKAKKQVTADHIFGNQSADDMASSLVTSYAATGDPYFDEQYVAEIQKVTREDILRVARHYLNRNRTTVAVITPSDEPGPKEKTRIAEPTEQSTVTKRILPNGMVLLTKPERSLPIVSMQFFGKGGLRFEPPDKPGLSRFTFELLTKGTKGRSKTAIAQAMEEMGGRMASGSGRNTFFVSVTVLRDDFEKGLDILGDVLTHPSFPPEEIEKQRKDTLLAIRGADESWEWEVERLFLESYYRGHPYENDILGTEASVRSFTREDILALYQNLVVGKNGVLAVFGDIDEESIENDVLAAFHDLKSGSAEDLQREEEAPRLVRDKRVEKSTDKVSAAIFVGYEGVSLSDKDRPVMDVIDAIISGIGYPSGWLHESLRGGTTSLVYFVHAFPRYGIDTGHFGIITQTTMGNYEEVLNVIFQKIGRLREHGVSDEELQRGKDMVITMHELGRETTSARGYEAALWEILGLGFDWNERYPELIHAVDEEDVHRVARKYFNHHLIASTIPEEPVEGVIPPEQQERMHVH